MRKSIKSFVILIMLLVLFVACGSKNDNNSNTNGNLSSIESVKEAYSEAFENSKTFTDVHSKITMNVSATTGGQTMDINYFSESWTRNGSSPELVEMKMSSVMEMFGMEFTFLVYAKDGVFYLDDGISKYIISEADVANYSANVDTNEVFDVINMSSDYSVRAVNGGQEITFVIDKNAVLKLMKDSMSEDQLDAVVVKELSGVVFINASGFVETTSITMEIDMEEQGVVVTTKTIIKIENEILPSSYEFEFPDFSEFIDSPH